MTERPRSPETLAQPQSMEGMMGRLILKDQLHLNPGRKVKDNLDVAKDIISFEDRKYDPFQNTSRADRISYWAQNGKPVEFTDRYSEWSQSVASAFNKPENKPAVEKMEKVLSGFGYTKTQAFGVDHAQNFYDRYFGEEESEVRGVKLFVQDVLKAYTTNDSIDMGRLNSDIAHITWLAGVFGEKSAEIVATLVNAEANLKTNPNGLLQKAQESTQKDGKSVRRINNLNPKEKELLSHISNHGEIPDPEVMPVLKYKKEIQELLKDDKVDKIIISAGTGTGKTTQVPQMIYELLGPDDKLAVTQPRRLPTERLSGRVAEEMEDTIGIVGHHHGEGEKNKRNAKILFQTEGMLQQKISNDPMLMEYNFVMMDEWHERHIDTDVVLALLLRAQELRKAALARGETSYKGKLIKPLKIIITSATLEKEKLQKYLGDSKTVEVVGRTYKMTKHYEAPGTPPIHRDDMPEKAVEYIPSMLKPGRNLVIFMPGEGLIKETEERVREYVKKINRPEIRIRTLYGAMSAEEQEEALATDEGKGISTIFIASPVAETSLTIPKADVISSGLVNLNWVDHKTGWSFLHEMPHSQKGVDQQAGRTARESDGEFRFLGTEAQYKALKEHHPAEIMRSDVCKQLMIFKKLKTSFSELKLIDTDTPSDEMIKNGMKKLKALGVFDEAGEFTAIGQEVVGLPVDVNIARMIVEAKHRNVAAHAVTLAALLDEPSLFERPLGTKEEKIVGQEKIHEVRLKFKKGNSDFSTLINIWVQYQAQSESDKPSWLKDNLIRPEAIMSIDKTRKKLLEGMKISESTTPVDYDALERSVFEGFKDRVMVKNPQAYARNGRPIPTKTYSVMNDDRKLDNVEIGRQSVMSGSVPTYIVSAGNYPRQTGDMNKIYHRVVQEAKEEWLREAGLLTGP